MSLLEMLSDAWKCKARIQMLKLFFDYWSQLTEEESEASLTEHFQVEELICLLISDKAGRLSALL